MPRRKRSIRRQEKFECMRRWVGVRPRFCGEEKTHMPWAQVLHNPPETATATNGTTRYPTSRTSQGPRSKQQEMQIKAIMWRIQTILLGKSATTRGDVPRRTAHGRWPCVQPGRPSATLPAFVPGAWPGSRPPPYAVSHRGRSANVREDGHTCS